MDSINSRSRLGSRNITPLRTTRYGSISVSMFAAEITVFDMTGLALQDLTVARALRDRATEANVGTSITWPW